MNDPERSPPALVQRTSFYHWVLGDLSPHVHRLRAKIGGAGVRLKGKKFGRLPHGFSGVNDYTHWFKTPFIKGVYGGYDGPCFPWNDPEQRHPITGVVFALNLPSLQWLNDQPLTAQDLMRSITGHIIGYTQRRWAVETPIISSTLKD